MDKIKHFIAGIFFGFFGILLTGNPIIGGCVGGLLSGVLKEVVDTYGLFYQKRTGFSKMDVVATLAGGFFIGLVMLFFPEAIEYLRTTKTLF